MEKRKQYPMFEKKTVQKKNPFEKKKHPFKKKTLKKKPSKINFVKTPSEQKKLKNKLFNKII